MKTDEAKCAGNSGFAKLAEGNTGITVQMTKFKAATYQNDAYAGKGLLN